MKFLASIKVRVFLTAWIVYSVHFATNVVREHYPAFSIAESQSFKVDRYQGFHADIFVHTDGHSYIGNNVVVSVLAAVPLFLFDPVLDALERYRLEQLQDANGAAVGEYRTDKPNRRAFFQLVRERGLDLRFGAATVVTSAFLMAPLSALAVVLMFHILSIRGVSQNRAVWLSLLFAFGTPVFFRTAHLNHNMFLMYALFLAFVLLWRPGDTGPVPVTHRVVAGFLGGFTLAADYMGVVLLGALYAYLLLKRAGTTGFRTAFRESLPFVAGSVPPVLFLLYSQWAMFGNPFLPGQYWMPAVNFTDRGWRGFSWPSPDLFFLNLFAPSYGLYAFGPLLILGLLPTIWYPRGKLILPRAERWFVGLTFLAVLTFCAANQYSRMQFNSGVRYLVPLIPLLFLALSDHLVRMRTGWLAVISALAVAHSWVMTVIRESVGESWRLILSEGIGLPWLRVLRLTAPPEGGFLWSPLLPLGVMGVTLAAVLGLWWVGGRAESRSESAGLSNPEPDPAG